MLYGILGVEDVEGSCYLLERVFGLYFCFRWSERGFDYYVVLLYNIFRYKIEYVGGMLWYYVVVRVFFLENGV